MNDTVKEKICITCLNKDCKELITTKKEGEVCITKCNNYIKDLSKIKTIKKITYLKRNTAN